MPRRFPAPWTVTRAIGGWKVVDAVDTAADGDQPSDPSAVERYLAKAFGDHLAKVRAAMEELSGRYEPAELNRIGFRLYERFRPEVPPGNEGWGAKAVLGIEKILTAA